MDSTRTEHLLARASSTSSACDIDATSSNAQVEALLELLANAFSTSISTSAFFSSLITSLGLAAIIALAFCFLRPLNNVVYAPRAKYADSKHAPPALGKAPLSWLRPTLATKEQTLVDLIGLDAALFIRFAKMCRNIFTALTVVGCGILIPVNLIAGSAETKSFTITKFLTRLTPQYLYGSRAFWAYVVLAYVFNIIICYFLWYNYRAVTRLRRAYYLSPEYQNSLHSRTLLMTEIPKELRSDDGLLKIVEGIDSTPDVPRTAIARNVKDLPDLVEEHEKAVCQLEEHLAKYLKNPDRLPTKRPVCKVSEADQNYVKGAKVDAIEYLTHRIKQLEGDIRQVRESVDKRNAMPYGFASYALISDAHSVQNKSKGKGPKGTLVRLAPKPNDLIWKNLKLSKHDRFWRNFYNNIWVGLLTIVWIVPNVLSAVFLSNLAHLGGVWPAFQTQLEAHPYFWGAVQGIAAPAISNIFYLVLPTIFRRLSVKAGDITKTSRERHVFKKLFTFFVFNNLLVYSLFSGIWAFIVAIIGASKCGENFEKVLQDSDVFTNTIISLETMSTYWLTWLLQRNLGAAIDLAQFLNLAWGSFNRKFLSPTPRDLIKLSAPQPFNYAGYYNYFLFYVIVTLSYAPIQPLVLPVTALYFWLDVHAKKYLLMYVFITRYESGGKFWRMLFNRVLFSALFGNAVIALVIAAQGSSYVMLAAMGPLPFMILGFKWYCARTFDGKFDSYNKAIKVDGESAMLESETKIKKADRVAVRFGNPVMYKPLMTPMVSRKAEHLLSTIYTGRTSADLDHQNVAGYSDVYMSSMSHSQPGKKDNESAAPFELVDDSQLDFSHYKDRPEFRDEAGGDGALYGRAPDAMRRGSGSTTMTGGFHLRSRSESRDSDRTHVDAGMTYPTGYHKPPTALRDHSPAGSMGSMDLGNGLERESSVDSEGRRNLLHGAAGMGRAPAPTPGGYGPVGGAFGGYTAGTDGFTPPAVETPEDTSYEYFRRGRQN